METVEAGAADSLPGCAHGDVVLDLDHLSQPFRSRAVSRPPLRQRDLPMLERVLRQQVAESLLTHVVPSLLGERGCTRPSSRASWHALPSSGRTGIGGGSRPTS